MTTKQAMYMRTIAQEGSITAAAKKLHVSQPSLSQMLRQVEEELGLAIFDRSVSPFQITFAGERYLQTADLILAANDRLESQLREIRHENRGLMRLGISVSRGTQVLPRVLPLFTAKYPNVKLELVEEGSADLEEMVRKGTLDLALAAIESVTPALAYELLERETIGILAGRESHLARTLPGGTPVNLSDARGDSFISLKEGHSVRVVQDKLFRSAGFRPHILLETDSLEVGRRVALGTGSCMLLSNIYWDDYTARSGAFYPLRDYENHRHFYACYRRDVYMAKYVRDFIQMVGKVLQDYGSKAD